MLKKIKFTHLLLATMIFCSVFGAAKTTFSQSLIKDIVITDVNYSQFPEINVTARVIGSDREPISELSVYDLVLTEIVNDDGLEKRHEVSFESEKIQVGSRLAIVLDIGQGITSAGQTGSTKEEEFKKIVNGVLGGMDEGDAIELILVRGDSTSVRVDLTTDKDQLLSSFRELDFGNPSKPTNGLDGVKKALDDLNDSAGTETPQGVLFITQGIQSRFAGDGTNIGKVDSLARKYDIPVHVVLVGRGYGTEDELQDLADTSQAYFFRYTSGDAAEPFLEFLKQQREQYQITYTTSSPSADERKIRIQASSESAASPSDTYAFTVDPAPQAPQLLELVVNNGDPVTRTAQTPEDDLSGISLTEVTVTGKISWPDGFPRDITKAELLINGQQHGSPIENPNGDEPLSFIWDLRSIVDPGINTTTVTIKLTDSLGLTFEDTPLNIPVNVVIPSPDIIIELPPNPCDSLREFPYLGESLYGVCTQYGVTPAQMLNMLIAIVALVLVIIIWFNRETVKDVGVRVTGAIIRATQQIMGNKEPKAYLEPLQGFSAEEMKANFELYGETPLGRDRAFAELIFNYPAISRLHCTLHEADLGDSWTIEDEDSTNGTYVNGRRLTPFDPVPIQEGDTIELARVVRGGIKFKFALAGDSYDASAYSDEEEDVGSASAGWEPEEEERNVRKTQPIDIGDVDDWGDDWDAGPRKASEKIHTQRAKPTKPRGVTPNESDMDDTSVGEADLYDADTSDYDPSDQYF